MTMEQTIEKAVGFKRSETFFERFIRSPWFWIVAVAFLFSYPIWRSVNRELPPPLPKYFQLPDYELVNEFGKPFGSKNLRGKTYIASFIFTSCPTSCPRIMEKMQTVQKRVRGLGTSIALVSYTVDPENDTPKVLFKYARSLQTNPHVWSFLTGEEEQIRKLLVDDFKVPMGELEETSGNVDGEEVTVWDIAHSNKFVLVDSEGFVRGYYGIEKADLDRLMIDVGLLINREKLN
jgi:protein SCO1/2